MNEREWLTCTDARKMANFLIAIRRASASKLRAVLRAGLGETVDVQVPSLAIMTALNIDPTSLIPWCDLFREIFGNPFRSMKIKPKTIVIPCERCMGVGRTEIPHAHSLPCRTCSFCRGTGTHKIELDDGPAVLSRHDRLIPRAAEVMYAANDFSGMPALSDMLEESGCENEDLLQHCRGMQPCGNCAGKGVIPMRQRFGPNQPKVLIDWPCPDCNRTGWVPATCGHVKGCWAIDVLLGKE
jgi:hypothetical protein